jgi:hypothetical protein
MLGTIRRLVCRLVGHRPARRLAAPRLCRRCFAFLPVDWVALPPNFPIPPRLEREVEERASAALTRAIAELERIRHEREAESAARRAGGTALAEPFLVPSLPGLGLCLCDICQAMRRGDLS